MKLPKQAAGIQRQAAPEAAAPRAVQASDYASCVASCSQLRDQTARDACVASCS